MRFITIALLIMLVSGCFTNKKPDTVFYEKPRLEIDPLDPIKMGKVEFIPITEKNADKVFAELKEKGIDPVLFGLTDNMYEVISKNYAKITIFITLQGEQIKMYREYYEPEIITEETEDE